MRVDEGVRPRNIGIQFTTDSNWQAIARKRRQLRAATKHREDEQLVDRVIIVQLSASESRKIYKLYQKWQRTKSPGGPDTLWDHQTKEKIFTHLLGKILSAEEMATALDLMRDYHQKYGERGQG